MPDDYIQQLEEAVNLLWGWMPVKEIVEMRESYPELVELCKKIHRKIDHEEGNRD